MNGESFHSVTLDPAKCTGCTTCIRFCPTEAIRVRKGRASIMDERCIDCGECIRRCPQGAKRAVSDPLAALERFPVRVAIPAPTLYGQFDERYTVDHILCGLLALGFTDVLEVAWAAELVSAATSAWVREHSGQGPWISSACPAVVKLIQVRFPSLLDKLVPILSPMEAAARLVKERMYPGRDDIGVFFISPCAAKVTVSRCPQGTTASTVDGVIGIKDVYLPLRNILPGVPERPLGRARGKGLGWAHIDGESDALGDPRGISVSGIDDVISVFEALENGTMRNVTFIEALACPAGCVGGPLTVENPYIARGRIRVRERRIDALPEREAPLDASGFNILWQESVQPRPALRLDKDILKAMIMMEEMEVIAESLPGLDCGSCGAPSCRAFAEDVARGLAVKTDCIFKLREDVRKLAEQLIDMERMQPPGLDKD
ncbi:MAG: 4Fe-4S binding protein [Spirochaetia bacterium]|nr:4Fe-4S binding protein [Spirochaetia bacterium]